jgi:hypothetical protein
MNGDIAKQHIRCEAVYQLQLDDGCEVKRVLDEFRRVRRAVQSSVPQGEIL